MQFFFFFPIHLRLNRPPNPPTPIHNPNCHWLIVMSDVGQKCLMLSCLTSDKMSDVSQNFSGTLQKRQIRWLDLIGKAFIHLNSRKNITDLDECWSNDLIKLSWKNSQNHTLSKMGGGEVSFPTHTHTHTLFTLN